MPPKYKDLYDLAKEISQVKVKIADLDMKLRELEATIKTIVSVLAEIKKKNL